MGLCILYNSCQVLQSLQLINMGTMTAWIVQVGLKVWGWFTVLTVTPYPGAEL